MSAGQTKSLLEMSREIEKTVLTGIEKFRDTLPLQYRNDAERFVRRAIIYYQTAEPKHKLHLATMQSFIMCMFEAAEIGLALDGRLAYAIVYNNKKKDTGGREYWEHEAQFMPDYKGLIAVAKRGLIEDIYAEIVCENDKFSFERTESVDKLSHSYDLFGDRGIVVGCYAKVKAPNVDWRFEILRRSDIDEIRGKSKAAESGPWKTEESSDWREMTKKTAIKRILKGFMDDPTISRAIELDDKAVGYSQEFLGQSMRGITDERGKIQTPFEFASADDRREFVPAKTDAHPEMKTAPKQQEQREPESGGTVEDKSRFSDAATALIQSLIKVNTTKGLQMRADRWNAIKEANPEAAETVEGLLQAKAEEFGAK